MTLISFFKSFDLAKGVIYIDVSPSEGLLYNLHTLEIFRINKAGREILNGLLFKKELKKNKIPSIKKEKFLSILQSQQLISPELNTQRIIKKVRTYPFLKNIFLETTRKCNLQCRHCYAKANIRLERELTTKEIKNVINQAHYLGAYQFDITGGEPLLRSDIFEILSYLQEKGFAVILFTNGTLINKEIAKRIASFENLEQVRISLGGIRGEIHDAFTRVKGSFAKTFRGIYNLKARGVYVKINIVITRSNAQEIIPLITFLQKEGINSYALDTICPVGLGKYVQTEKLDEFSFAKLAVKALSISGKIITKKTTTIQKSKKGSLTPPCGISNNFLFISSNGDVSLCPTLYYHHKRFLAGNVKKETLKEIWEQSSVFKRFRNIQCKEIGHCKYAFRCRGGCRSRAYTTYGGINEPDYHFCAIMRAEKRYAKIRKIQKYRA